MLPEPENLANLIQYNDTVELQRPWRLAVRLMQTED
jgi:hypothetical protein